MQGHNVAHNDVLDGSCVEAASLRQDLDAARAASLVLEREELCLLLGVVDGHHESDDQHGHVNGGAINPLAIRVLAGETQDQTDGSCHD